MAENEAATAGALGWGVKQSFRNYVESAGGTIEFGAGAAREADGAFTFVPAGDGLTLSPDGRPQGVARFQGELRFEAHGGMLKVFMADPAIEIGEAGAFVTVAETPERDKRVELARLDLTKATQADSGALTIPTVMARDGWRVLGDHYLPGTPLDPVVVRVAG